MRQLFTAVALILLIGGIVMPAQRAHALDEWCPDDPVVKVHGTVYDITVLVPAAMKAQAGLVTVYVPVPEHGHAELLKIDQANFAETVVFVPSGGTPLQSYAVSSNPLVPTRVVATVLGTGNQ